jgi:hypothetical protein
MEPKNYLLRIELLHTHRPIWREVWVPSDLTLDMLHYVIQEAMGWDDDHMHCFEFKKQQFQSVEFMDGFDDDAGKPEELVELSELLKRVRQKLSYTYDFGDNWQHSVTLKKQVPLDCETLFTCVAGEGACPLEDCGGVYGHERICAYVKDGVDDGYMPYEEWGVKNYDPDLVDLEQINEALSDFMDDYDDDEEEDMESDMDLGDLFGPVGAQQDLGLFGGMEDDSVEAEDACAEPYFDFTEADRKQFREAMDQADVVRALAPWKDLWDQDIFCIKDPDTGLLDFVSILGRGGEVYALHVHHGIEGYHLWQRTMLGTMPMDDIDLYMRSLRLIEVEFVNKEQMEPEDLDLYDKAICFSRAGGRLRWTKFRRYHPRAGAPWFPESDELPRLVRAMHLCVKYVELMRSEPKATRSKYTQQDRSGGELAKTLPCFTLSKRATKRALSGEDTSAWEVTHMPMDWEEGEAAQVPFEPTEFEVQRVASLPVVEEAWELGAVYLSNPIGTEHGPSLPILAVAAPLAAMDEPPRPHLVPDLEVTPAQAVWDCLVAEAVRRGARPAEVHVTTPVAQRVLQPLTSVSSTEVVLQSQFQQLHELLSVMSRI